MTRAEDILRELWCTIRAPTPEGARARRRAAVMTGVAAFVLLLFTAIGFLAFILIALGVVASATALCAMCVLGRRYRRELPTVLGALGKRIRIPRKTPSPLVERRTVAINANARGTERRRAGDYEDAADQHRLALAIFRALGDRHAEALTLNNLALALDHAGDPTALDLFEAAATILGALGDEQYEGQVITNLALALRRRGSESQCAAALDTALDKLDPKTTAYRKVESLRRAS